MDDESNALCYFYRHPPPNAGVKLQSFSKIAALVWEGDWQTHPTRDAVYNCVKTWRKHKAPRGRKRVALHSLRREARAMSDGMKPVRVVGHRIVLGDAAVSYGALCNAIRAELQASSRVDGLALNATRESTLTEMIATDRTD